MGVLIGSLLIDVHVSIAYIVHLFAPHARVYVHSVGNGVGSSFGLFTT